MIFFTSDLHLGDDRLELYHRNLISDYSNDIDNLIISNWNNTVKDGDKVYCVGDIVYAPSLIGRLSELNGEKILITGNYDIDKLDSLMPYFDSVYSTLIMDLQYDDLIKYPSVLARYKKLYLNHYPNRASNEFDVFNIVGHIHGLWQVQPKMINVSTDAWHFTPVSLDTILWKINAIIKYYDVNVFPFILKK